MVFRRVPPVSIVRKLRDVPIDRQVGKLSSRPMRGTILATTDGRNAGRAGGRRDPGDGVLGPRRTASVVNPQVRQTMKDSLSSLAWGSVLFAATFVIAVRSLQPERSVGPTRVAPGPPALCAAEEWPIEEPRRLPKVDARPLRRATEWAGPGSCALLARSAETPVEVEALRLPAAPAPESIPHGIALRPYGGLRPQEAPTRLQAPAVKFHIPFPDVEAPGTATAADSATW